MFFDNLAFQYNTTGLLKASPKGEGFHPSQIETLNYLNGAIDGAVAESYHKVLSLYEKIENKEF